MFLFCVKTPWWTNKHHVICAPCRVNWYPIWIHVWKVHGSHIWQEVVVRSQQLPNDSVVSLFLNRNVYGFIPMINGGFIRFIPEVASRIYRKQLSYGMPMICHSYSPGCRPKMRPSHSSNSPCASTRCAVPKDWTWGWLSPNIVVVFVWGWPQWFSVWWF